ncbi:hypothetical protein V6N11_051555 [Hibiscus sabdariffa]|uniref:Pectinesterase inhibitor domain-containing protein n=1 Tax=Hibiscus sabdariffa TaxID=183260 RepID=A0ABR2U7H4_9ROSI
MQTISAATADKGSIKTYKNFIKSACNSTTYPKICYQTLSPSASAIETDPYKLCNISMSATLNATHKASSAIGSLSKTKGLSPSEKQIVGDCAEITNDAIDELQQSLKALANLQGSDHKAGVMTIASSINVSGGHVNPTVIFSALLGRRISLVRAVYYWVAQLLGAIVACLLLRLTTGMQPGGSWWHLELESCVAWY